MQKILLINNSKKDKKIVKEGYSFSTLFFNFLVPMFRKDLLGFLIMFSYDVLSLVFWKELHQISFMFLGVIFFPVVYNKFYIWTLCEKGYNFELEESESLKAHFIA